MITTTLPNSITRVKLSAIQIGSAVDVRGNFGTGPIQSVVVEDVCDDVKNGFPGIDYVTHTGDHHWCYLDQVIRVIAK